MHNFETVLTLLVGVTLLALMARRFQLPTPALLVVGGLLVAVVPGLPTVQFDPQLVFLIFIPPLLYRASLLASYRDVRANFRPILSLGVGHVLFATLVVAWVAHHAVPGLPWAAAFALGAVVSPPDVAAATAFLRRLPLPRRVVTILEGESMINDAAAIVAYRMAVAAAVTGTFSLGSAGLRFVVVGTGGVLVGLAVGWLLAAVRRRIHDPEVENTISLLSGYAAYLPAEHLGVSGILAVVAMGIYLGRVGPRFVAADTRVQNAGMWDVVVFVLEGLIFILTGLALRPILEGLSGAAALELARAAVLVSLAVVIARLMRRLGVRETGEEEEREEIAARLLASEAALARLEELASEPWMHPGALSHTRDRYRHRTRHLRGHADGVLDNPIEAKSVANLRLARELLAAERQELLRMRDNGAISDAVMRRVQQELDYEELLLHHE